MPADCLRCRNERTKSDRRLQRRGEVIDLFFSDLLFCLKEDEADEEDEEDEEDTQRTRVHVVMCLAEPGRYHL